MKTPLLRGRASKEGAADVPGKGSTLLLVREVTNRVWSRWGGKSSVPSFALWWWEQRAGQGDEVWLSVASLAEMTDSTISRVTVVQLLSMFTGFTSEIQARIENIWKGRSGGLAQ